MLRTKESLVAEASRLAALSMDAAAATFASQVAARTAIGEARGEGVVGMSAVLNVICNRAAHPRWWGHSIAGVCLAPWQFSAWNDDDPNLPVMLAADLQADEWSTLMDLAESMVSGMLHDATGGADSYFDVSMLARPPEWAQRAAFTVQIGRHRFYRVELANPLTGDASAIPIGRHSPAVNDLGAADLTADELNQRELDRLAAQITGGAR